MSYTNDNWSSDPALVNATSLVGAFPLNNASYDAVLLVNLPPGSYTAQVDAKNGSAGVCLIEIYDVPGQKSP